jgi:hypothetical protein
VSDGERVERLLTAAFREAAERVEAQAPGPDDRLGRPSPRRTRALVRPAPIAVALLAAAVLGGVWVVTRQPEEPTVATDAEPPQQVEPVELGPEEADIVVVMAADATADQLASVRDTIASSPGVVRFAEVTVEEAIEEAIEELGIDCQGPGDMRAGEQITPGPEVLAGGIPGTSPSFRIVTDGADERVVAPLRDSLAALAGVMSVDAGPATDAPPPAPAPMQGGWSCREVIISIGPGDGGEGPASPPFPAVTAPTLPAPTGEEPADPDAARAAIVEAYTTAADGSLAVAERRAYMEDSADLGPYLDRAAAQYPGVVEQQRATLGDIVFLDAERAAVVYTLSFGDRMAPQTNLGFAVLDDGRWKVSRETLCALILRAGVTCPPRTPS